MIPDEAVQLKSSTYQPNIRNLTMIRRSMLIILIMHCTCNAVLCQHQEASRHHCPELEQLRTGSRTDAAKLETWMGVHHQLSSACLPELADMIARAAPPLQHNLLMLIDLCMDTLYYANAESYLGSTTTPQQRGVAIALLTAPKMTYGVPDSTGTVRYPNFGVLTTKAVDVLLSWIDMPCTALDLNVLRDVSKESRLSDDQWCARTRAKLLGLTWMYCGSPTLNGRSDLMQTISENPSDFPVDAFKKWYHENKAHLGFDWRTKQFKTGG